MTRSLRGHFDGKVIVPDEPVELPVGSPLRVQVDVEVPANKHLRDELETSEAKRRDAELLRRMEQDGSLERCPAPSQPLPTDFRPLVIEGEPLSETILKGRR